MYKQTNQNRWKTIRDTAKTYSRTMEGKMVGVPQGSVLGHLLFNMKFQGELDTLKSNKTLQEIDCYSRLNKSTMMSPLSASWLIEAKIMPKNF